MAAPVFATNDVPTAAQVNDWFVNVNFARKSTQEDLASSTTLQNDDQLFVTVAASAVYRVTANLIYRAQTAGDIKIGWTAPGAAVFNYTAQGLDTTATGYTNDQAAAFVLAATPIFGGVGASDTPILIEGLLVTSSGGTFQLQWAQGTSNAGSTSMMTGSFLDLRRLA
jgi:hypothetical protein